MPRIRWRPGDYLIVDDSSGLTHWASEVSYDWDGAIRLTEDHDGMHPDYARVNYPLEKYPDMVNVPIPVTAYVCAVPSVVGETSVSAPPGPAPDRFII